MSKIFTSLSTNCAQSTAFYASDDVKLEKTWGSLFAVLSSRHGYLWSDWGGGGIINWKLMLNPIIWLGLLWIFVVSIIVPDIAVVFTQPYVNKTIIWSPFSGFKQKRPLEMNLMHGNTENISHAHILAWLGMTSSLAPHDITQRFCVNLCLILAFDTKIFNFRLRWKTLMANKNFENLAFISINLSFRQTVQMKTSL